MTDKPNTILVIGPSWVGDMVMAQSLFKTIKQDNPSAIIDVLAPAWTHPLLSRMPEVRQGILISIGHGVFGLRARYRLAKALQLNHYDQAIVLANTWKSALIPFFAKIPKRTGWRGEMRWGLLNDMRVLIKTKLPLMIDRYAALGRHKNASIPSSVPLPALLVKSDEVSATLKKFSLEKSPMRPLLILCPGAEAGPAKRWPVSHFVSLAQTKIQEGWQVWLMGSKNDINISTFIQDNMSEQQALNCVNITGKTSLHEAIVLLSVASQVVANDSGLMHIAAALNVPLVGIFGPTDPNHTPPLSHNAKAVSITLSCRPCFKPSCPLTHNRCMHDLKPEQVLAAFNVNPV